jgi:hypothetical protein
MINASGPLVVEEISQAVVATCAKRSFLLHLFLTTWTTWRRTIAMLHV